MVKAQATEGTVMAFVQQVAPHMVLKVSFQREALVTECAWVRALPGVHTHVHGQSRSPAEGFTAHRALQRLGI